MGPLTTHFHRRSGKVSHYREFLFFNDGDLVVAGYDEKTVTRPFAVAGQTIFDKEFKAFRVQRVGSPFTTIVIFTMDSRPLGTYSDVTMPYRGVQPLPSGAFETTIDDLYLDHFIFPDGRRYVLDLGEFHEGLAAGRLSATEAALAMETVGWIEESAARGEYPKLPLAGLHLDPALLDDLPQSQEQEIPPR
jgi:predicted RNA-binding protein associated with RNAse of E/G family